MLTFFKTCETCDRGVANGTKSEPKGEQMHQQIITAPGGRPQGTPVSIFLTMFATLGRFRVTFWPPLDFEGDPKSTINEVQDEASLLLN